MLSFKTFADAFLIEPETVLSPLIIAIASSLALTLVSRLALFVSQAFLISTIAPVKDCSVVVRGVLPIDVWMSVIDNSTLPTLSEIALSS